MNMKKLLYALCILPIMMMSKVGADTDTVMITNNSFDLVGDFTISPKEGYPVFATVYPYEGKARFNSSGKGKALCEGWLAADTKISIETHHDLLMHSANNCGVTSTISIEPGRNKEHDNCASLPTSKFQTLSCLIRNMPVDSFVIKFETKKVTKATDNCNNGNADTKEIRLHANYKQTDWDASYYSLSLNVMPAHHQEDMVQDNKADQASKPSENKIHIELPAAPLPTAQLTVSQEVTKMEAPKAQSQEQPEPHAPQELPEVVFEDDQEIESDEELRSDAKNIKSL